MRAILSSILILIAALPARLTLPYETKELPHAAGVNRRCSHWSVLDCELVDHGYHVSLLFRAHSPAVLVEPFLNEQHRLAQ